MSDRGAVNSHSEHDGSRAIGNGKTPAKPPFVIMVTPGGLEHGGGIGRMVGYMLDAWSAKSERPEIRIVDSRGPGHIIFSPLYLASCLATIAINVFRKPLVHIHAAGRGSTVRKIVVAHFAWLLGLPIVLHLHDYNYADSYNKLPAPIRAAAKSMFRIASRVLVLSKVDQEVVVTMLGVRKGRVEIVYNAVPRPAAYRDAKGSKQTCSILFLGNPSKRKGVHDLLHALKTERLSKLSWCATIAGGGNDLETFREQARESQLLSRVTFPGWVNRAGTAALLRSGDILVLPSYDEGMAMSVLEGTSYGLCVVCTPVGGLAEVIENDISGRLVSPGDVPELAAALEACIADERLRARLGAGARRRFEEKFDSAHYPDRLQKIYEGILQEARSN